MSIFIPDRAIVLPKDIAVPQSLSETLLIQQKRDVVFLPKKRFDGAYVDAVTNTKASCAINGARYGIVNGVLTQFAVNQAPVEDKGLRGCPAFTQYTLYSEDPGAAAWVLTQASLVLATTYMGSNTFKLKENTSTGQHHIRQACFSAGLPNSSVIGLNFIAKAVERNIIAIQGYKKDGTYLPSFKVNLSTGSIITNGGFPVYSVVPLSDGYYSIFLAFNVGTGSNAPYFFSSLNDAGGNGSYAGDGTSGILLGQVTHTTFGVNGIPFIPPYVPNNTSSPVAVVSEAGTSTTGTSFDLDEPMLSNLKTALRGPNAQGRIELEFEGAVDSGWLPNNTVMNVMSMRNNAYSLIYFLKTSVGALLIRAYDGTNGSDISLSPITVGKVFRISLDYGPHPQGGFKARLTVNDQQSDLTPFSGSWGVEDLRVFYGNTIHIGWIKKDSLKTYPRPRW